MTEYKLIKSDRKTISIQIKPDGCVTVRAPKHMKKCDIDAFVKEKDGWIQNHLTEIKNREAENHMQDKLTDEQLDDLFEKAKNFIPQRVSFYCKIIGVSYGRITIRNQRSRWGSCSSLGNLNFNCLLMLCPLPVIDYVVIHELCHRKHLDHSKEFWIEVENVMPDYKTQQKWLKENGTSLINRML